VAVSGRRRFAAFFSMSFMITLILSMPVSATEKEDLERLIERPNRKRSTPEKVSEFVSKSSKMRKEGRESIFCNT
jgi:hypothetical protein